MDEVTVKGPVTQVYGKGKAIPVLPPSPRERLVYCMMRREELNRQIAELDIEISHLTG
jgi:hypothetical protein